MLSVSLPTSSVMVRSRVLAAICLSVIFVQLCVEAKHLDSLDAVNLAERAKREERSLDSGNDVSSGTDIFSSADVTRDNVDQTGNTAYEATSRKRRHCTKNRRGSTSTEDPANSGLAALKKAKSERSRMQNRKQPIQTDVQTGGINPMPAMLKRNGEMQHSGNEMNMHRSGMQGNTKTGMKEKHGNLQHARREKVTGSHHIAGSNGNRTTSGMTDGSHKLGKVKKTGVRHRGTTDRGSIQSGVQEKKDNLQKSGREKKIGHRHIGTAGGGTTSGVEEGKGTGDHHGVKRGGGPHMKRKGTQRPGNTNNPNQTPEMMDPKQPPSSLPESEPPKPEIGVPKKEPEPLGVPGTTQIKPAKLSKAHKRQNKMKSDSPPPTPSPPTPPTPEIVNTVAPKRDPEPLGVPETSQIRPAKMNKAHKRRNKMKSDSPPPPPSPSPPTPGIVNTIAPKRDPEPLGSPETQQNIPSKMENDNKPQKAKSDDPAPSSPENINTKPPQVDKGTEEAVSKHTKDVPQGQTGEGSFNGGGKWRGGKRNKHRMRDEEDRKSGSGSNEGGGASGKKHKHHKGGDEDNARGEPKQSGGQENNRGSNGGENSPEKEGSQSSAEKDKDQGDSNKENDKSKGHVRKGMNGKQENADPTEVNREKDGDGERGGGKKKGGKVGGKRFKIGSKGGGGHESDGEHGSGNKSD